jgi:hypothetical protein
MAVLPAAPGWPRPFLERAETGPDYEDIVVSTPALFIGGELQVKGDWLTFDETSSERCRTELLCAVCGEELRRIKMYGAAADNQPEVGPTKRLTNGPAVHPKCFALTLKFCPHFARRPFNDIRRTVVFAYDGPGLGVDSHEELFEWFYEVPRSAKGMRRPAALQLARDNPMGD